MSKKTFKVGSKTVELAGDGIVVDAVPSTYKVINFNTLNNGDSVKVLLIENGSRFTEIVVRTAESRTQTEIVEAATNAVKALEALNVSALTQTAIDAAQAEINLITSNSTKSALQARLDAVQDALDNQVIQPKLEVLVTGDVTALSTDVVELTLAANNYELYKLEAVNIDVPADKDEVANITTSNKYSLTDLGIAQDGRIRIRLLNEAGDVVATVIVKNVAAAAADLADVATAKAALTEAVILNGNADVDNVETDLTLSTSGTDGTTIAWATDNAAVVATNGTVTRPATIDGDAVVTLTATITKGAASDSKTFTVTVKAQ